MVEISNLCLLQQLKAVAAWMPTAAGVLYSSGNATSLETLPPVRLPIQCTVGSRSFATPPTRLRAGYNDAGDLASNDTILLPKLIAIHVLYSSMQTPFCDNFMYNYAKHCQ